MEKTSISWELGKEEGPTPLIGKLAQREEEVELETRLVMMFQFRGNKPQRW